jgi:methyl-accepting chemotaxis protein
MLSLFRNRGVGTKIGLGYAMVTLILIGAVGTTIWQVRRTADVTNRVVDLRAPTAQASLEMLNGMNHSLAALRGWIILGKDKFKDERAIAWSKEIEPALAAMKEFAVNWTDPKNIERLEVIDSKLGDFKTFQREIEDIAQTIENTPATKILFEQAAPKAKILSTNITKMIDLEAEQEATPERKALLGMMADVRGTLGLGLGAIRAYLLSGDESFKQQFDKLWTKNTRRFADVSAQADLLTPEQREAYELFAKARQEFDPLPPKMFEIRGGDEWNLANRWLGTKAAPTAFAVKENLDAMIASQRQLMATDMAEGKSLTASLMTIEWILLGAGVALCAILGTIITRSITKPVNRIIAGLNEGADQVNDAAGQVSSASQQLAEGASEQASSLEETSSALEQMAAMTRTNSENAKQANELADQARTAAQTGDKTMGQLNEAMTAINESSGKISKIIKVIEEIAFQTNLLALNAAVEAARAGEHGKGFAVVADEVRNLAMRAAEAARETTGLIEDSTTRAKEGTNVAGEVGKALGTIVADVTKVADLVSGITKASEEQAQGVDQVNTAVSQMDKVTQQNAAGAEESASAAEELSAQAQAVKGMVNELAAIVGGSRDGGNNTGSTTRPPGKTVAQRTKPHGAVHSPQLHPPRPQPEPLAVGACDNRGDNPNADTMSLADTAGSSKDDILKDF